MAQIDITTKEGHCYFYPSERFNDFDCLREHAGVSLYRRSWWGWLLSWLGWSVSLKGSNGKIHYVRREELDRWIDRCKGPKEGDYHQRIAETLGGEKLRKLHRQIRRKALDRRAQSLKCYVAALKAKAAATKIKEKEEELDGLKERLENRTFKIMIAGRTILAKSERMATSHYFKNFLTTKENVNRFVRVRLEWLPGAISDVRKHNKPEYFKVDGKAYTKDPFVFTVQNIEIDGNAFEILKVYLEAKSDKKPAGEKQTPNKSARVLGPQRKEPKIEPSQKAMDSSQQTGAPKEENEEKGMLEGESEIAPLLTPDVFEGLYKLHQIIDISGIMEIAYKRIDFYSDETVKWHGIDIPLQEFWPGLAKDLGDKKLQRLCEEKYREGHLVQAAIQSSYKQCGVQGARAARTVPIKCSYKKDGSLKLTLQFIHNSQQNLDSIADFLRESCSFPSLLTAELRGRVTSIIIDFNSLTIPSQGQDDDNHTKRGRVNDLAAHLNDLLRTVHDHLTIGRDQPELIIQGRLSELIRLDKKLLSRLLEKYSRLVFSSLKVRRDSLKIGSQLVAVFKLLYVEGINLETSLQLETDHCAISASVQKNPKQERSLTIFTGQNPFDLGGFDWLEEDVHLIIDQEGVSGHHEPWKGINLEKVEVKKLTIRNAALNRSFAEEAKKLQLSSLNVEACSFLECEDEIGEISSRLQEEQNRLNRVQLAIDRNNWECTKGPFEEMHMPTLRTCDIVQRDSNLIFSFKMDSWYFRSSFNPEYYKKRFSLLNHLTGHEIADARVYSIVVDCSQLMKELSGIQIDGLEQRFEAGRIGVVFGRGTLKPLAYLRNLLRDLDQQLPLDLHFELQGLPYDTDWEDDDTMMNELKARDNDLIEALRKLLLNRRTLIIDLDSYPINLEDFLPLLETEGFALETRFLPDSRKLVLAFVKSVEWSIKLVVEDFYDLRDFQWVQHPIHLVLYYPHLQPWTAQHLNQLLVRKLTIENAELNQAFVEQLAFNDLAENELQHLTTLTFTNCKISPEVQEHVEANFMCRNALRNTNEPEKMLLVK